jgi:ATP adenylyltransferase
MDRLWTPWRYSYITDAKPGGRKGVPPGLEGWPGPVTDGDTGCVFCNLIGAVDWAIGEGMARDEAERHGLVVARTAHGYVCLNRYPYSSGHVLILPYRHTDSLAKLPAAEAAEMMGEAQRLELALRQVYEPDGINIGLNLGKAAGAGVANHLHMHVLPRWFGDTNFMTATAETRILPETLDETWRRIRRALESAATLSGGDATDSDAGEVNVTN